MSTTAISVRLDSDIKEQFDKLCKEFGISTNAAFNIFARAVVREKAIPFAIVADDRQLRSLRAQSALKEVQKLSSQESHEWTDDESDDLIAAHRQRIE